MKIKLLIVEDEVILADEIEASLMEAGYDVVGNVCTGEEALNIVKANSIDLILMDINLKGNYDGIETTKLIQKRYNIPIIYLTDIKSKSIWEKAKVTNPAAYLIKPFNQLEVDIAFQIALKNASSKNEYNLDPKQDLEKSRFSAFNIEDRLYLRVGNKFIRILLEDILFIKGAGSYCELKIDSKEQPHVLSFNLSQFKRKIPFDQLERIHKSYIININKITSFEGNRLFIDKYEIPIGKNYREEFMEKFKLI